MEEKEDYSYHGIKKREREEDATQALLAVQAERDILLLSAVALILILLIILLFIAVAPQG
jgi:hypothetical protein